MRFFLNPVPWAILFGIAYVGTFIYFYAARRSQLRSLAKLGLFFVLTAGANLMVFLWLGAGARHSSGGTFTTVFTGVWVVAIVVVLISWWRLIKLIRLPQAANSAGQPSNSVPRG